jgi:3-hydroxyisobutyrate dehydrogenase-like beta-hydroxyacid dehydrogenase
VTTAVVGLGAMGARIARRLLEQGHDVLVWNRTPARADALVDAGAVAVASPAEAADRADVVLTVVSDATALRDVSEGASGLVGTADESVTVIEMSTVGPAAVSRLASALPGVPLLDAPVLGSISEAEAGTLRIFIGGPEALVTRWAPLLSALGTPIRVGPLGAGAAAKLVANSTLLGVLAVLGEALAVADGLGLSREAAYEVLAATPLAAQADRRRAGIETGEFPTRFSLSLARKDADLILEHAAGALDLRVAAAARSWLAEAENRGWGDRDYAAVLAHIVETRPMR